MPTTQKSQSWQKPGFIISTDKTLLSVPAINHAFGLDLVYWTNPVPEEILRGIIDNSFCLGLYEIGDLSSDVNANTSTGKSSPLPLSSESTSNSVNSTNLKQIGFARLVGDMITFAYFTDLYVLPEYQGFGLGGWLIDCIGEVLDTMPYLRWAMLRTSLERSRFAYEKKLGMDVLVSGNVNDGPVMMGRKGRLGGP